MINQTFTLACLFCCFVALPCTTTFAQNETATEKTSKVAKLIGKTIKVKQTEMQKAIDKEQATTGELSAKLQLHSEIVSMLNRSDEMDSDRRKNEIRSLKRRIAILEVAEEMAGEDKTTVDKRIKEEKAKVEELSTEIAKAREPFEKDMQEIMSKYTLQSSQLASAVKNYFRAKPEKPFSDFERTNCYGIFAQAIVNATYSTDEKPVCTIALYFDQQGYDGPKIGSINMQHDLLQLSDRHAVVRTNGWILHIYTRPNFDWNAEKIKEAIPLLVDLDGLAKIDLKTNAEPETSE